MKLDHLNISALFLFYARHQQLIEHIFSLVFRQV
jgi:hypothetical protein